MVVTEIQGFRLSPPQLSLCRDAAEFSELEAQCKLEIEGPLVPERLKKAIEKVIERHDSLRTFFHRSPGMREPIQVIQDQGGLSWAVTESAVESAPQCFEIDKGSVAQAVLSRVSHERHVLFLRLPILRADHLSLRNIVQEMGRLYDLSPSDGLPEDSEALQYIQFSEWRNEVEEENNPEAREYWRRHEEGARSALRLPFERSISTNVHAKWGQRSEKVGQELFTELKRLASSCECSEHTVLLACMYVLAYRWTSNSEVVVGHVFDGRSYREFENAVGLFARRLPLRCHVDAGLPFSMFVREVERLLDDAREWQDDFQATPDGEAVGTPVVSLGFDFVRQIEMIRSGDLAFRTSEQRGHFGGAKVQASLYYDHDDLEIVFYYDRNLFAAEDVDRMMAQYLTVVRGAAQEHDTLVGALDILSIGEKNLLRDLNQTYASFPLDHCLHALFEEQAAKTPNGVAVRSGGAQSTYRELDQSSNQLARALRDLGVGPDTVVAFVPDRSSEMMTIILAILKAGGAYLPLDLTYPSDRLSYMLEHSGTSIVLASHRNLIEDLPLSDCRPVLLDGLDWRRHSTSPVEPRGGRPENLAYILYTSGSTGQPKGVMIPHRGLVNYLSWCVESYGVTEGGSTLVHSLIGFDLTVTSLFSPLLVGGCVELLAEGEGLESLASRLQSGKAFDLVKVTPSHLEALSQLLSGEGGRVGKLIVGGEALVAENLKRWRTWAPDCVVVNEYGPTEAVVGCCVCTVAPGETVSDSVAIGRPIANAGIYLVDRRLELVPVEIAGELLIGGVGLSRGYLGKPARTADSFVPDPFGGELGARLYRSGDLARLLADGVIEFLGRWDHQVKIRGFRVELGEIEAALHQHEDIRECAIRLWKKESGDPYLVAYFVPFSARGWSVEAVSIHLRRLLPDYMVPSEYVVLESLPLTVNGKVDRAALPPLRQTVDRRKADHVAPRDRVEALLVQIWEDLLNIQPISVTDGFFDIGGHSLLAVRLMVQVRKRLGRELPLESFLVESLTIEELAKTIRRQRDASSWSPLAELQAGSEKTPFFLIHPHGGTAQDYRYLVEHLDEERPVYGLQARGRLDSQSPLSTVEEMAELYISAVRERQPQGPYRLAGWSFGGMVAYEMAQRLRSMGEEVDFLGLFDSLLEQEGKILDDAGYLIAAHGEELSLSLEDLEKAGSAEHLYEVALQRAQEKGLVPENIDLSGLRRALEYYRITRNAGLLYEPQPYPGPASFFMAKPRSFCSDPTYGLKDLVKEGFELFRLPAPHTTFLKEPNAAILGNLLNRIFDRLDRRQRACRTPSSR